MPEQIEGYRLSPQQKRLWQLQPAGQPFRSQCAILLEGSVRAEVLREALQVVVNRHEILRTSFYRSPGVALPIQVIADSLSPAWRTVDLSDATREEQSERLESLFAADGRAPFNFELDPALSATLMTLSSNRYVLQLSLPSLSADAWSLGNLLREIAGAYAASLEDGAREAEVTQYLQFSEWQNELLEDENAALGEAYWSRQETAAAQPTLPFERKPRGEGEAEEASVEIDLDAETSSTIEALASAHKVSAEVLLLSCWQTLLWRLTGQPGIRVGQVVAGRKYDELHEALGLFAKALPVDCRFEDRLSFVEVLRQVSEAVRDAEEWQEWFVWPERDGARRFHVGFELAEWPARQSAGGVTFSLDRLRAHADRFHLKLDVVRRDGSLSGRLAYDIDRFEAADIRRLAGQFRALLGSVIENPSAAVGELRILSGTERRRLLVEFNETEVAYPQDKLLHELFEEQAARTPDGLAVSFKDERLTYAELNARANQLAHYLKAAGIGPESLVAVALDRSPQMVVAMLAVLKAGGAYVPLDMTYPPERVSFMLEDAAVPALLTQERILERLPFYETKVVCLDAEWPEIARQSSDNPRGGAHPQNPAYVIYTSGSTGRPKGVVIPHLGLVNYLSWATERYEVGEGRGAAVHSPVGFDLTVTTLFAPLLAGRSVLLVPEEQGIEGLSAALQSQSDWSLVKITPSHLEVLNHLVPRETAAGSTRAIVIGGEALSAEHIAFWREHAPETHLINEYGPTEAVVGCCVYEVPHDGDIAGPVPIGRPIANARIYLLDANLHPVPTHVAGELHIGGVGLARGYLNRPDLTAEKFIPDPFSAEPGARLYRTGDLARFISETNVEYLGRRDQQVKLRGFRIELGEIEAVLGQSPDVRETVVELREDMPGDRRLVAYVVPRNGTPPQLNELRGYLQTQLPEYMIPASFVTLDALPLTPNGKVNRRALPVPEGLRPKLEAAYVAPQNETERIISAIWQEALQIEKVGIHDNFFDLGGHSLLMVRVNRKLQEALHREITMIDLFKFPTINALAQFLHAGGEEVSMLERSQGQARARRELGAQQRELREKRRGMKGQREV